MCAVGVGKNGPLVLTLMLVLFACGGVGEGVVLVVESVPEATSAVVDVANVVAVISLLDVAGVIGVADVNSLLLLALLSVWFSANSNNDNQ